MFSMTLFRRGAILGGVAVTFFLSPRAPGAAAPTRGPDEDVKSTEVRERAGLAPGRNLLHTGWGVTPAGDHVRISDMPLKMIVSPDKRMLVTVSGRFHDTGVTLIDLKSRQVSQFLPLKECWNGLAFSSDGKRLFASGGDLGVMHVFDYADGKATAAAPVKPVAGEAPVFLAGIAIHPTAGKLYVCNEANHEIWVLHPQTLALEATVAVGQH